MDLAFITGTRGVWGCFIGGNMPWWVLAVNICADITKEYNLSNKEKDLCRVMVVCETRLTYILFN